MTADRFRRLTIIVAIVVLNGAASTAVAQRPTDRVRLLRGSESGEITDMSQTEITLNKGLPGNRPVAVNQIRSVVFDGEPPELSQARVSAANGNYQKALDALEKIDVAAIRRDFIKQDIEFYTAFCAGKLALSGNGEIIEAGRQLNSFVRANPKNFHYLAATELMGDLLMADGRFEPAQRQYAELGKAPWPDYKIRAAVASGRTLQAQGKHAEAIAQFDAALAISDESADAESQKLSATLGKAVSQSEAGSVDQAVSSIESIIQKSDPQEKELHARAYNALGTCYEKAGQTKDALIAFLHVDVLYNTVPEAHAEALAHMVPLWEAIGQQERARESREQLQQRYAGSSWAKQLE
jgi:tetratricopeptide (TPR) repeat protein